MSTGLPWSDPNSDPIGDIKRMMEATRNTSPPQIGEVLFMNPTVEKELNYFTERWLFVSASRCLDNVLPWPSTRDVRRWWYKVRSDVRISYYRHVYFPFLRARVRFNDWIGRDDDSDLEYSE